MCRRSLHRCVQAPVPVAATVIPSMAVAATVLVVLRNRLLSGTFLLISWFVCSRSRLQIFVLWLQFHSGAEADGMERKGIQILLHFVSLQFFAYSSILLDLVWLHIRHVLFQQHTTIKCKFQYDIPFKCKSWYDIPEQCKSQYDIPFKCKS